MQRFQKQILSGLFVLSSIWAHQVSAQGVGINTKTPDPSAALDITATDKGVLVPRVALQNLIDKTTVPNPANALMVFNTNAALKWGIGFYYNAGTPASPEWKGVSDISFPYVKAGSDNVMFDLQNYSANTSSTSIHAYSNQGYALQTEGKIKIAGSGQVPGKGKVLTSDADGNATWQGGVAFSIDGVKDGIPKITKELVTKIPFKSEQYDLANNYNTNDGVFIAPVNGIYHFDLGVEVQLIVSYARCQLILYVVDSFGDTIKVAVDADNSSSPVTNLKISKNIRLSKGSQVYASFYYTEPPTEAGAEITFSTNSDANYFNGHFVAPF